MEYIPGVHLCVKCGGSGDSEATISHAIYCGKSSDECMLMLKNMIAEEVVRDRRANQAVKAQTTKMFMAVPTVYKDFFDLSKALASVKVEPVVVVKPGPVVADQSKPNSLGEYVDLDEGMSACIKTAAKHHVAKRFAEDCEDFSCGCPGCPWK